MTHFDLLLKSINKHITLNEGEQKHFTSLLRYKLVRRKQFLFNQGEICHETTFVINGCLRGFTVDKNAIEHVLSFAPQGWWIADMYSFFSQNPGQLNIEALEDTEVLLLDKKDLETLYFQIPKFERFFRIITQNALVTHQQRLIDNLSLSAEERYLKFCKTYPSLINQLPQKQIASFLGVTPEFFSRMRTGLLKNS